MSIIDTFVSKSCNPEAELSKTLALSALFVATKFEDIISTTAEQLCKISQPFTPSDIYTIKVQDIHRKEFQILNNLDFNIKYPTSQYFFELFSSKLNASQLHKLFGQFLLEIILLEHEQIVRYKPSFLAMGALFLVVHRIYKASPTQANLEIVLNYQKLLPKNQLNKLYLNLKSLAQTIEQSEKLCLA